MDDPKAMAEFLYLEAKKAAVRKAEAKQTVLPPDPMAKLDEWEESLNRELPEDLQEEFKETYRRIGDARYFCNKGLTQKLKILMLQIYQDLEAAAIATNQMGAFNYSTEQRIKAQKPRGIQNVEDIINRLAMTEHKPGELWELFWGALDAAMMEPRECQTKAGESQVHYTEDETGKEGHITLSRFRTRLREARKKGR